MIALISVGLFTPDLAFDAVVKKQITKLKEPSLKSVDLVVTELGNVVRRCTNKMNRYPRLRDELERIITTHIRQRDMKTKEQILLLNEDFIGFARGETVNRGTQPNADSSSGKRKLGNQVIRKGWMCIHNVGIMKGSRDYWFILTSESLSWFKDEEEKDKKYMLLLDGLKLKDTDPGFITKEFIKTDLLPNLYSSTDQKTLMEESPEEVQKRKEILRLYQACKQALQIIGDVSMHTSYHPVLPPIKTEWQPQTTDFSSDSRKGIPSRNPPVPSYRPATNVQYHMGNVPVQQQRNSALPPPLIPMRPVPSIPPRIPDRPRPN